MISMKNFLALLLILIFASTGNAGMRYRLQPILSGELTIAVDTFIIGTQDKFIATIVRDFDPTVTLDMSMAMSSMLAGFDHDELAIMERRIFGRNDKKLSLVERRVVLRSDFEINITNETFGFPSLEEPAPGSMEEFMWYGIAGPGGWGTIVLGEFPEPIELAYDKIPVNTERYVTVVENPIGGIFIDKNSIRLTEEGVSALIVEGLSLEAELDLGVMALQLTHQDYPLVDAYYAVTETEFSFARKALRQLRYTVFGPNHQIIYAVRIANPEWTEGNIMPLTPVLLGVLARHLPEDIAEHFADDIESYREYMRARTEYMRARYEAFQRWQREQQELEQQNLEIENVETENVETETP